jgi:hypothetical protein
MQKRKCGIQNKDYIDEQIKRWNSNNGKYFEDWTEQYNVNWIVDNIKMKLKKLIIFRLLLLRRYYMVKKSLHSHGSK